MKGGMKVTLFQLFFWPCLSKSPKEEVEVQWSALVNKKSLADDSNLKRIVSGANIDREIY